MGDPYSLLAGQPDLYSSGSMRDPGSKNSGQHLRNESALEL